MIRHTGIRATALLLAVSLTGTGSAAAQDEAPGTHQFGEVMVTATKTERKTQAIPAGASAVTEEEIATKPGLNVKQTLEGVPGVNVQSKNNGYDARLIIRGNGLKARYGIREISILLDGVPITDPDGMTRMDFVDTQLIKQVDVVRGPNSTLYGANAAGGVINVITRSPFEETKLARYGIGSFGTQLFSGILGESFGNNYFTATGTYKETDGWREWNRFDSTQVGGKFGHLFSGGSIVEANYQYTKADFQLPGSLTKEEFEDDIRQRTSDTFKHSSRDSEVHYSNVRAEKRFGAFTLKPLAYLQYWEHFHPVTGGINDGDAWVYGGELQGDYEHTVFGGDSLLTLGLSGQIDDSPDGKKYAYADVQTLPSGRVVSTLSDRKGEKIQESDETVIKWGVFAQESLRPADRWIVDLGIRYDRVSFDLETDYDKEFDWGAGTWVPRDETVQVDEDFDYVSPRIGVVFEIHPVLNLYGTISTGFRTPQGSELEENPDLAPAETVNYEVGAKARFPGGHNVDLSLFREKVDNEIVQVNVQDGDVTYQNAGGADKYGLELAGELQTFRWLSVGGSYTYSHFEFDDFEEPVSSFVPGVGSVTVWEDRNGNQLPLIPNHQYNLYAWARFANGLQAKVDFHTWGEYWMDNANTEKYSGYDFLTNAFIGWSGAHWDVSFNVENFFNKRYAIEVTKDTTGTARYVPGAPWNLLAKVAYRF